MRSVGTSLPPRPAAALRAALLRLAAADVPVLVSGGTGRRLLGALRRPADLDLECRGDDIARAARALGFAAPRRDAAGGWSSLRCAGRIAGVDVDLSAGVAVEGPHGRLAPDEALMWAWALPVRGPGVPVWCAPPEEALARTVAAGDWARLARLAAGDGPAPRPAYVARRLASVSAAR
ncbi:MAG TPA: hypothetical protein VNT51_01695 [Miltoncostaeaceae bacterium]|nr:hypothetical protein [Miltoncostaeaceae bacterium]